MRFVYAKKAKKQFEKLDTITQKRIKALTQELETLENPRSKGEALVGNLSGLWQYRVRDYRIICEINDNELLIYAIHIAHRKEVYK
ncbi:type II toxin-antitoxin system RelE family toxin [Helicobacter labetoulli]|uniref:type II toxin-antitoxin system RelE family toxin n=1 Tax=Helicobacter labetoulli TaxID=2315333 RepID=UPI000EF74ADC|nr:type II toxin-antitoxin system RelE/ParE family toxin [Helicobacter labetoulli]